MNPEAGWSAPMSLSGNFSLRVGVTDSISGQRPILGRGRLARLLRGQRAAVVERTLGNVFTLCAHAHRRVARLALNAARPDSSECSPVDPAVLLIVETARDHLRSMALDWPQRQSHPHPAEANLDWLRGCPLSLLAVQQPMQEQEAWAALARLRTWLGEGVLGLAVNEWLVRHRDPEALARWCQQAALRLDPARCLNAWYPLAHALKPGQRNLDLLDADSVQQCLQLRQLGQALAAESDFAQRPVWLGQCAETGPWSRLRHGREPARMDASAWTRLSARWIELMELAVATPGAEPGAGPLSSGSMALGNGQAIAWCEMARGLLLHWVQLDAQGGVHDYRVVAPTEWNFHPGGALAQALTQLHPDDSACARILAAAYDPCVDCSVLSATTEEPRDA
jgi:hypothetical protein